MTPVIWNIFKDFLQIGLFSIGGGYAVIPAIKAHVVDLRHWLTPREFTDIITISQMTPGPLAVNTSTFAGLKTAGIPGALAATIGCVFSGFIISLILLQFFNRYKTAPLGKATLMGLKAASLGLITSAAATILTLAFAAGSTGLFTGILFIVLLMGIQRFRISPVAAMVISGIAGLLANGVFIM